VCTHRALGNDKTNLKKLGSESHKSTDSRPAKCIYYHWLGGGKWNVNCTIEAWTTGNLRVPRVPFVQPSGHAPAKRFQCHLFVASHETVNVAFEEQLRDRASQVLGDAFVEGVQPEKRGCIT
jgi:hypothetical protein